MKIKVVKDGHGDLHLVSTSTKGKAMFYACRGSRLPPGLEKSVRDAELDLTAGVNVNLKWCYTCLAKVQELKRILREQSGK